MYRSDLTEFLDSFQLLLLQELIAAATYKWTPLVTSTLSTKLHLMEFFMDVHGSLHPKLKGRSKSALYRMEVSNLVAT